MTFFLQKNDIFIPSNRLDFLTLFQMVQSVLMYTVHLLSYFTPNYD